MALTPREGVRAIRATPRADAPNVLTGVASAASERLAPPAGLALGE